MTLAYGVSTCSSRRSTRGEIKGGSSRSQGGRPPHMLAVPYFLKVTFTVRVGPSPVSSGTSPVSAVFFLDERLPALVSDTLTARAAAGSEREGAGAERVEGQWCGRILNGGWVGRCPPGRGEGCGI